MKLVNIQFFALPKEIITFLGHIKEKHSVFIYVLFEKGNIVVECKEYNNLAEDFSKEGSYSIVLSLKEILSTTMRVGEFQDSNPNALYINVGKFKDTELKESWMYSLKIANDENCNLVWIKVGKELKKLTLLGGYYIFEPTNEKRISKTTRYTKGALDVYLEGYKILPASGKNIYFELGYLE